MYFKKTSIIFFLFLVFFLPCHDEDLILIDKIAAVVNGKIIAKSDIDKALVFYPFFRQKDESKTRFQSRVLDDLINYKIIYIEYKDDFKLRESDFEKVQIMVINKLGSIDNLLKNLKQFSMNWQDFKEYIKEKTLYKKILTEKFQMEIVIDFKDIREFYDREYVIMQKRMKIAIKPFVEMAPLIEQTLQKRKTKIMLSEWLGEIRTSYTIENKLLEEKE